MARPRKTAPPPAPPAGPRYVFAEQPLRMLNAKLADPQKLGEALDEILRAHGGQVDPFVVVEAARDPSHAWHPHLNWDDRSAAEERRADQVRHIIRLIRIWSPAEYPEIRPPRAFVNIRDDDGHSYRALSEVAGSGRLQAAYLAAAERDLLAFERRYQEILDVCELVRAARERLAIRRRALGDGAPAPPP
jgi:hypothetical protein